MKNGLEIQEFSSELAPYFYKINKEWVSEMFVMEEIDQWVLSNPYEAIITPGGKVYFAKHPDIGIVGTCALMKKEKGVFELTKMGVFKSARGLKVGEFLLKSVLKKAQDLQIPYLFLLTNSDCKAAIHLYEKNGFIHDDLVMSRFGKSYERCNVAMSYKENSKSL